jgi:heparinase II/III-like protein
MKVLAVLQRESPLALAREAFWRARRRWRQIHLKSRLESARCPVVYRPLGYYQLQPHGIDQRSRETILSAADAVCGGWFPWFAYPPVHLGFPPRWNLDFVSGISWPAAPGETVQVVRHDGSDVKIPWDLSRLQFLPVLGKAWRLSGEERYRMAAKELLSDWIEKNPPGAGINWTIAMEAALRAISICLFLDLLTPQPGDQNELWWRRVTTSLWQHLLFIEAHNEFSYFVRGNHYLSNLVGLFCLASFLRGPGIEKRKLSYRTLLEHEMLLQVYEDGGGYEASTGYHLLNLQMFTTGFLLMRCQGIEANPKFSGRLRGMYRFLAALSSRGGRVPHLGDCDDGRIELMVDDLEQMLSPNSNDRYSLRVSGILGVGEALFQETYGGNEGDAAWYGPFPASAQQRQKDATCRGWVVFPDSGLAVGKEGPLKVVFLAMPNGIMGKGTHTHNDKLSVIVTLDGEEVFSDSGTGCYTRDVQIRNQFRSTSAHNTVQIDGEEQNRFSNSPESVFSIGDDAHATPIAREETPESLMLWASHDGYARLDVRHTRKVKLGSVPLLTMEDCLTGSGPHSFELRFHLHRQWRVKVLQGTGTEVKCFIEGAHSAVELTSRAVVNLQCACIPGRTSTAYGLLVDAQTISVRGSFEGMLNLVSCLSRKV